MTPEQIEAIAAQYTDIDAAFGEAGRVEIHAEPVKGLGTYRLHMHKPVAGVGGKSPRWRIEISLVLEDGKAKTLNDGKAHAPWTALQELVSESLKVMDVYVQEGRGQLVQARRDGMRAV